MEQENIKKILTDLYSIDPSLKSKEADLITAIKIMQAKKENGYDKEFSARLRGKLLLEANKSNKNHNRYFIPVFAVSSLVLLCFVGIFSFNYFDSSKRPQVAIERVGDDAFGVFSSGSESLELAQNCANTELPSPVASAVPASGKYAIGTLSQTSISDDRLVVPSQVAPAANPVYSYAYDGDDFSQNDPKMDVLKKIQAPLSSDSDFARLYGTMDLKTFSEKNISNATFQQDKPFGYIINVDFTNGAVSISENYSQWPQDESISENFELTDNSETIFIADKFLKDHGISVDSYGKAKIMESGQQKIVQIVYPLIINGRNVYNPDGTDIGIFVSVDMEHKMVSSLYGLGTQKYQASSYPVIQGKENILSKVESEYSSNDSDCRPSDVDMEKQKRLNNISKIYLSTPEAAYVQVSKNDSGSYGEFLVPAFVFPIKNPIDSREKIIVPLVKGLDL